ncbi:MAG: class I SAM-dependent methyltransferase [Anaerolineales bacterium]|nr:class I SAM-dependent methyltransferase [Anaerolineales bacterium]
MTVKSQPRFFPNLLSNRHYSGTVSTLLYNWSIFAGALFFSLVTLITGMLLPEPWPWLFWISSAGVMSLCLSILVTSYLVYDRGQQHEYDRLAELGQVDQANVIVDITCGKLRGTRGLLPRFKGGHYFLIDIYNAEKMPDSALRRARELEPPLQAERRIYQRPGQTHSLPLPHNWADIIYCSFSLHELHHAADRDALFAEFARVLKPGGRLLIAEHGRDWFNFAAFGPGVFSYFSPTMWQKHLTKAGLTVQTHERWRSLVHLWVATREPR